MFDLDDVARLLLAECCRMLDDSDAGRSSGVFDELLALRSERRPQWLTSTGSSAAASTRTVTVRRSTA